MPYVMSLIIIPMSIGSMSHVDFKKWLCRPVEFRGKSPHYVTLNSGVYRSMLSIFYVMQMWETTAAPPGVLSFLNPNLFQNKIIY